MSEVPLAKPQQTNISPTVLQPLMGLFRRLPLVTLALAGILLAAYVTMKHFSMEHEFIEKDKIKDAQVKSAYEGRLEDKQAVIDAKTKEHEKLVEEYEALKKLKSENK